MSGKFRAGAIVRTVVALALTLVMVTGQFPLSAFAEVLQAGKAQEPTAQIEDTKQTEGQEPSDGVAETPVEEQPAEDNEEPVDEDFNVDEVSDTEQDVDKKQGVVSDEEQSEVAADEVSPRAIESITAERWTANQKTPDVDNYKFTIKASNSKLVAAGDDGLPVADLAESPLATADGTSTYTFWKVSLKGVDKVSRYGGGTDYGAVQTTDGQDDQTGTGTAVTRIRSFDGKLQFMVDGNWISLNNGTGSTTQLVFYYLQDMAIGDYVDFHMAQWFTGTYTQPEGNGNPWNGTPKGVVAQVVDEDTGKQLAQSSPMYYYWDHGGVTSITATERSLGSYEITKIEKSAARNQTAHSRWTWVTNPIQTSGDPLHTYAPADMTTGMSTTWVKNSWNGTANDPLHIVFTIYVRRTAQVSLEKMLAGDASQSYAGKQFEFTAQVTLPEGSKSTLRDSYPATGLANGKENVSGVVSSDGKTVSLSGIRVKPGDQNKVTIKGLPTDAVVKFTEVGVIEDRQLNKDPSLFRTTYANDKDASRTDGSAVAKPEPAQGEGDARQTVTTTNEKSDETGKLTVTKTFKNIGQLSYQERMNLRDSFRIESTDNQVPALTTKNANSVNPAGGLTDMDASEVTYTWTMNHLKPGSATLTETNYQVGDKVSSTTEVNTNGASVSDSVSTEIKTEGNNTVTFTNDYTVKPATVNMRKVWADGTDGHPDEVTVNLVGKVGEQVVSTQEVKMTADSWTATVDNLPSRLAGTSDAISYSIVETKVGDTGLAESGYKADYTTGRDGALVVTNSKATGEFSLTKLVAGTAANKDEEFTFEITAVGNSFLTQVFDGMVGDSDYPVRFSNGVATVKLKRGQTLGVSLPVGKYQVKETGVTEGTTVTAKVNNSPAKVQSDGPSGEKFNATINTSDKVSNVVLDADGTSVEVTNTADAKPNLGISSNILPMAGLAAVAIAGGTALVMVERKRNASSIGNHAWKE